MRIKKLLFNVFSAVLFAAALSGCKGHMSTSGGGSDTVLKSLTIKGESGNDLEKKQFKDTSLQLEAVLVPSNASVDLKWESSEDAKAEVNELGYVTFKNAGGVTIKVTDKKTNLSASFNFEVEEPAGEEDPSIKIKHVDYFSNGWIALPDAVNRVFNLPELSTTAAPVSIRLRVRPENPSMVDKLMFKLNENGTFAVVNKNNIGNYEVVCNDVKEGDNVITLRLIAGSKYNDFKVNAKVTILSYKILPDKDFNIDNVKGDKATLLIFSQDTCGMCDIAYAHSVPLYNKYHGKGLNIVLFMRTNTGSDAMAIKKMAEYKIPYPCYGIKSNQYVLAIFNTIQGTPWAYLLDKDKNKVISSVYVADLVDDEIEKLCK